MSKLFLGVLFFGIGQIIIWYQTNGQFLNKWAKDHPLMMSLIFGTLISYNFILGTKYIVEHFDGQLWPGRLIGLSLLVIISWLNDAFRGDYTKLYWKDYLIE